MTSFCILLMSVPLRNRGRWGLAGMQRDKAPEEWPRSEGGDPTEGSMLGRLLWKPTPTGGPLHSHTGRSQWRKNKKYFKKKKREKRKERIRESTDWGREREGGKKFTNNFPRENCKRYASALQRGAKGKSPRESEAALPYINFCQSKIDTN